MKGLFIGLLVLGSISAFARSTDNGNLIGNYDNDKKSVFIVDTKFFDTTQVEQIASVIESSQNSGAFQDQRYTSDFGIYCVTGSFGKGCKFELTKILATYDKAEQLKRQLAQTASVLSNRQKRKLKEMGINF